VTITNAIEALNRQLRKAIKTKGHIANEAAARKPIYLATGNGIVGRGCAAGATGIESRVELGGALPGK
jgi:hypothetical protein